MRRPLTGRSCASSRSAPGYIKMPGLTFLNLAFLAGLAAAAVPILIHLLSRRRAKRTEWGSVHFLRELYSRRVRRVRLRQWLLLALRTLAILLFALAMMRPTLTGSFLGSGRAPSTVCLVIDTSLSMSAAEEGVERFQRVRERAKEIAGTLGTSDQVHVIPTAGNDGIARPYPLQAAVEVVRQLDELEVTEEPGSMLRALERAGRFLRAASTLNKEVYVLTDLQRSAWRSIGDSLMTARLLPEDVGVCVVAPPERAAPPNVALIAARSVARTGGGYAVEATVANFSDQPLASLPVDVERDGHRLGEVFVDLSAHGTVRTRIDLATGVAEGPVEVRIPEDALAADDVRHVVLGEGERVPVAIIADRQGPSARAATFMRLALEPAPGTGRMVVDVINTDAVTAERLAAAHVAVLCGPVRLEHVAVDRVRDFVRSGGGLLIIPSEQSDLRFYNDRLADGLLEVQLAAVVEAPAGGAFRLTPAVAGHPVFAGFTAGPNEQLTRARFHKVVKVVPRQARVLARFRSDLPALVEGHRTLFFASSMDRLWNDLPTSGAFVPLVCQAVAYLADASEMGQEHLTGRVVDFRLTENHTNEAFTLNGPDGEPLDTEMVSRDGVRTLRVASAPRAGIYTVERGGDAHAQLAVNVDPVESDLTRIGRSTLSVALGGHPWTFVSDQADVGTAVQEARYGRELWRWILALAMALLVIEVFVSRGKESFTPAAA